MVGIETKSFKVELKAKGEGRFYGIANAYGVKDHYGEIVDPGACKRTLDQKGPRRRMLWNHNTDYVIGHALCAEEATALTFEAAANLKTTWGSDTYALIEAGDVDQMSIGFTTIKEAFDADGVRHLVEINLMEISPVAFAANELAIIEGVKAYGYGRDELTLIIEGLRAITDPVSDIITRHQAGKLTIKDRQTAVKASSILQDLIKQQKAEAGPGDHPAATESGGDPQPAEQLSDSEFHSLMEAARSLRASIAE